MMPSRSTQPAAAVGGQQAPVSGNNSFFDEVVRASGLAGLIATAAITRACHRAGVDPSLIDPAGLEKTLPFLEMTLRLYVPDEAETRLRALLDLTRSS